MKYLWSTCGCDGGNCCCNSCCDCKWFSYIQTSRHLYCLYYIHIYIYIYIYILLINFTSSIDFIFFSKMNLSLQQLARLTWILDRSHCTPKTHYLFHHHVDITTPLLMRTASKGAIFQYIFSLFCLEDETSFLLFFEFVGATTSDCFKRVTIPHATR